MMESGTDRLRRFREGPPLEIVDTLLNSIDNYMNREIALALTAECWDLTILGIHAVALTVSEGLYGTAGPEGFKLFLKNFVDVDEEGYDYSIIGGLIHNYRNNLAHQWLAESGYGFGFDTGLVVGWSKIDDITYLNPRAYGESYLGSFSVGGKVWDWATTLEPSEQEAAKARLVSKFTSG
jgi:hypothetical protein